MTGRVAKMIERIAAVRPREPHFVVGFVVLAVSLWIIGFANFLAANGDAEIAQPDPTQSLGIVVLTGGTDRIAWGMQALSDGRGERLLISGVNEIATREELGGLVADPRNLFECCVDLDYASVNTAANATQAIAWARDNEFNGLWVVTSYYHMPRALLEFRHHDADFTIYPLSVEPENYDANDWWHPNTLRILGWEYTKYELALMRVRTSNLLGP